MKLSKLLRVMDESNDLDENDQNEMDYPSSFGATFRNDMYDPLTGRMLKHEQMNQKRESALRKLQQKKRVLAARVSRRLSLTEVNGECCTPIGFYLFYSSEVTILTRLGKIMFERTAENLLFVISSYFIFNCNK